MSKDFDEVVLEENGFKLEFSNKGDKRKPNPNPVNYRRENVKCRFEEGCERMTRTKFGLCSEHNKKKYLPKHEKDWIGRIIPQGYTREQCLTDAPAHHKITEILVKWMGPNEERRRHMDAFMHDLLEGPELGIVGDIPDATTLQHNLESGVKGKDSPNGIVERIRKIIEKHFPKERFQGMFLDGGKYKDKSRRYKSLKEIPLRIVVAMLVTAFVCEESNRGDLWYNKTYLEPSKSKYASAYMPSVYYFLRRHTRASERQARMSLRS